MKKNETFVPRRKLLSLGETKPNKTYAEMAEGLGYKYGTVDCERAINSIKWWFTSADVKERKRKKTYESRKKRYRTDENYRQAQLDRFKSVKRKERAKDPEKVRSRARDYYARNRREQCAKILANRYRRDPTRGLGNLIKDFKAGRVDVREVGRRLRTAITQCDEFARGVEREILPKRRIRLPSDAS